MKKTIFITLKILEILILPTVYLLISLLGRYLLEYQFTLFQFPCFLIGLLITCLILMVCIAIYSMLKYLKIDILRLPVDIYDGIKESFNYWVELNRKLTDKIYNKFYEK